MTDYSLKSDYLARGPEELSQRVLDSLTAELAVLDHNGTIIATNKAWRQFAADNGGTEETTGVGVNYLDVCYAVEGDDAFAAKQVAEGVRRVLGGLQDVFKFEYPCHSASQERWFLLHVSRLAEADYNVVVTHLSITERKITEQKLVLAERLAAIGEAMNGLSHEGRNALQRAQAHIELLRFHVQENPEAIELLEKIENAQDRMLGLYEEVKRYASPINLQIEPCDLGKLIEIVWKEVASTAKPPMFSLTSTAGDLICDIDLKTISYVLLTLFRNALAASTDNPKIDVTLMEDELEGRPSITMVVSDNGTGIAEEDWEQAFQPFYTTKTKGTGLGLTLARRVVFQHHGSICFGQPRLSGASVYVNLPRQWSSV